MKTIIYSLTLLALTLPFVCCGQNFKGRSVLGEKNAKEAIRTALANKNSKAFYDTLIKDNQTAIEVVEPILFKIYGKENIIRERPYESYLINGYWYICGTLPENWNGGVFEIIVNSKNGQVIKLIHGK